MKHILLTLSWALLTHFVSAQTPYPPVIWASGNSTSTTAFDGPGVNAYDMATSGDGVFVAFRCYTPLTFNNGQTVTPAANSEKLVLAKYNLLTGAVEWVKDLGFVGPLNEGAKVCRAANGSVIVAASFSVPQINFGNGATVARQCAQDCDEVFLVKFASDGQAEWAKTIYGGASSYLTVTGVRTDNTGKLHVSGNYTGTVLRLGQSLEYTNLPGNSFFLAQYDAASGNPQQARFASPDSGQANSTLLAVNEDGQAVLAGSFSGTLKLPNAQMVVAPPNDLSVYFVAGVAPNGDFQWLRMISSGSYADILNADIDATGRAYLAIDASTEVKLDNGSILTVTSTFAGSVLRLNASGFAIPVFIECNTDDYVVTNVALDLWGNIYTAGFTSEPVIVAGEMLTPNGCFDVLLSGTSYENFSPMFARTLGGPGCEVIENGYRSSTITFDQIGYMYAAIPFINGFSADGFSVPGTGVVVARFHTSIVGTDEASTPGSFLISPNPSTGSFSLQPDETLSGKSLLSVFDSGGRMVFQQTVSGEQIEVNTTLPAGIYIATLQNGMRLVRQKLVVKP